MQMAGKAESLCGHVKTLIELSYWQGRVWNCYQQQVTCGVENGSSLGHSLINYNRQIWQEI